jgi:hypothetical protein
MTSFDPDNNNNLELNGIKFQTLISECELQISLKQPGTKTKLQLGIEITNNTEIPHCFLLFFGRPKFLQANKQKLPRFGSNVNGSYNPEKSDFKILAPGESASLLVEGYFCWEDNKLKYVFREPGGQDWIFYENQYPAWEQQRGGYSDPIDLKPVWENQIYNNPRSDIYKIEDVWVGEIYTHPTKFNLIQKSR